MSKLNLSDIRIPKRHRKEMGDLSALAESIERVGLLQPIVVRPDNSLVAGARRIKAVKKLGWTDISTVVARGIKEEIDWLIAERDENTCRKDFTPSEKVAIGKSLLEAERRAAK